MIGQVCRTVRMSSYLQAKTHVCWYKRLPSCTNSSAEKETHFMLIDLLVRSCPYCEVNNIVQRASQSTIHSLKCGCYHLEIYRFQKLLCRMCQSCALLSAHKLYDESTVKMCSATSLFWSYLQINNLPPQCKLTSFINCLFPTCWWIDCPNISKDRCADWWHKLTWVAHRTSGLI